MQSKRRVLCVIMDGVGERAASFGNAVQLAYTPNLDYLHQYGSYTTLRAHGKSVGMPSDADMGNSEVGHNTLGAGRVFEQGSALVQAALASGSLFQGQVWRELMRRGKEGKTLHFLGLLSDGNVHSHEKHLYALLRHACQEGVRKIRVHVLFDGRDVAAKSAEIYADRLEVVLAELRNHGCDAYVASGGGRMSITMDRYEADWSMVERGWRVHVEGLGRAFPSLGAALAEFRRDPLLSDQYLPEFIIHKDGEPAGRMQDDDGVILFNFRGDRAIEITRAFEERALPELKRTYHPRVYFAGMMQYDGDKNLPQNYLVSPPAIAETSGEYLARLGLRQFACSETQKFGHVTYFWNGNRSGFFDPALETYVEVASDLIPFQEKPWMRAQEITSATIAAMVRGSFDFGRINYANGDMVGHTGDLAASVVAVSTVDLMLGKLIAACRTTKTVLVITADHGNCEEMFEGEENAFPNWRLGSALPSPAPKTSHTLSPVPFFIYDPCATKTTVRLREPGLGGLANVANTILQLMGVPCRSQYEPSLILSSIGLNESHKDSTDANDPFCHIRRRRFRSSSS